MGILNDFRDFAWYESEAQCQFHLDNYPYEHLYHLYVHFLIPCLVHFVPYPWCMSIKIGPWYHDAKSLDIWRDLHMA